MKPKIFTSDPSEYVVRLLGIKSSDAALSEFGDLVDSCYALNGLRIKWRGRFGNAVNKELVDRAFCDFVFTDAVTDTVAPIRYFKAWRYIAEINYFGLNAVGAMNEYTRTTVETTLRAILKVNRNTKEHNAYP